MYSEPFQVHFRLLGVFQFPPGDFGPFLVDGIESYFSPSMGQILAYRVLFTRRKPCGSYNSSVALAESALSLAASFTQKDAHLTRRTRASQAGDVTEGVHVCLWRTTAESRGLLFSGFLGLPFQRSRAITSKTFEWPNANQSVLPRQSLVA